jgi:hypothetical protein
MEPGTINFSMRLARRDISCLLKATTGLRSFCDSRFVPLALVILADNYQYLMVHTFRSGLPVAIFLSSPLFSRVLLPEGFARC